jgi:hypothetical protein
METVKLPLLGGCDCGRVRYALRGAPLLVYACHCHDCQTRSGSAFSLTAVINTADLVVTGPAAARQVIPRSGQTKQSWFCSECQVPLHAVADAAPDYASIRVGTFDDARWAKPIAQAFVESAIPWAIIPGIAAIPPGPIDFYALGEQWRASAPAFVMGQ